jgi:uncharacterized damage-inducible protein DinB
MMNKSQLTEMWDLMRQSHGIGLRAIEALPADKIDATVIPNMRTPKQLVVHMYAGVFRELAEGTLRGKVMEVDEKTMCDGIETQADLLKFATEQWRAADKVVSQITDTHLTNLVPTPWHFEAPGSVIVGFVHDEYLHHRGQLYAYLRALGKEPPMLWDFEHNAPEFQPKQAVQALEFGREAQNETGSASSRSGSRFQNKKRALSSEGSGAAPNTIGPTSPTLSL